MIPIARPLIGAEEQAAVLAVLESGQLAQGSRVAEFERRFAALCGTAHAVATSSGTTALHLALLAHDIGEGDEVITTSGLYGFITGFDGDIVWLEIDDNVQIRVARQAVARMVDTSGAPAGAAAADADDDDEAPSRKGSTAIDDIVDDDSADK